MDTDVYEHLAKRAIQGFVIILAVAAVVLVSVGFLIGHLWR